MDKLFIKGPAKLSGTVRISNSKNAYLPILAATLLTDKKIELKNLPNLRDIRTMIKLLENLGVQSESNSTKSDYIFDASKISSLEATYDLVKTMRASILVLGPLVARYKSAKVSLPGGCAIGTRPIDIHLSCMAKLGATIRLDAGYVEVTAEKLIGTRIILPFPSVGATENLMMAATLAQGETVIDNAAMEPEIEDLGNFLIAMGVSVEGLKTSSIKIMGTTVNKLKAISYEAIPDRIETGTYLMAALATNSEIKIENAVPSHLNCVLDTLISMGAKLEIGLDYIKVFSSKLRGVNIDTAPYPGFPTDLQAQLITLATQVDGQSIISEHIFENRFMHVPELNRLGANIVLKSNSAVIGGNLKLKAAPVMCTDLRASAALVMAALVATGTTEMQRVYHLDRGYDHIDDKLIKLGVSVERINESKG